MSSGNGKHDQDAVILSAARTPIGRLQGALAGIDAPHLGAAAVRAAVERAGVSPAEVEEVLMGQVVPAGSGLAPARQAAIYAGLPEAVGATSLNKACGSGLKAVMWAAQAVRAGDASLLVAGGMESMSAAPYLARARQGLRFGHQALEDSLLTDGLWCSFENWAMGNAAEFIGEEYEVTRAEMDQFALESHQKAVAAIDAGRFRAEIVLVEAPGRKAAPRPKEVGVPVGTPTDRDRVAAPPTAAGGGGGLVDTDEGPRRDTSLEALARLKPAFQADGKVTAGNAPGLNDGECVRREVGGKGHAGVTGL